MAGDVGSLSYFIFFIEVKSTQQKINPFEMNNSVAFSVFTTSVQFQNIFITPEGNPVPKY